ncbi:hypothetical protein GCM10009785_08710 [Brooklawnia cerclae]|uniref:Uncharacterized protein n=1 Tax=Brooklawnia cerclae TaxID=349934 RepID=A0ABX0SM96_9ACTN|nr:hypothetical protein [Brooklawnia cerclae]NIH58448.1 hypothetical protein [Brooklawnia cerclae]
MTTSEITGNAQSFLFPTTSDSTIREGIIAALRPYADDYDLDAIEEEFAAAIQEILPEGFTLNGQFIFGPTGADVDWDAVREAAGEIDLYGIAARHEIETVTALLDELNAYTGDDVWGDVILGRDGYDDDTTTLLDPSGRSDVAVVDGHVLRWIEEDHEWIDRGGLRIAEVADAYAARLPEGYRAHAIDNGQVGAIIKAEPWVDQNGRLRWSDSVAGSTDDRGDVQILWDQDGDGSLHGPDIVIETVDADELRAAAEALVDGPSVVDQYRAKAEARVAAIAELVRAEIAAGDYSNVGREDQFDELDVQVLESDPIGSVWIGQTVPSAIVDPSWDWVEETIRLTPEAAEALHAHLSADED